MQFHETALKYSEVERWQKAVESSRVKQSIARVSNAVQQSELDPYQSNVESSRVKQRFSRMQYRVKYSHGRVLLNSTLLYHGSTLLNTSLYIILPWLYLTPLHSTSEAEAWKSNVESSTVKQSHGSVMLFNQSEVQIHGRVLQSKVE